MVVWCTGRQESGDEFVRVKRATTRLTQQALCPGRPLLVARDHTTPWVWLPLARATRLDVAATAEALAAEHAQVRVALGELRRTLRAYSAANRSATATARLLSCHKNTVQYRIRSAERLLGHPVEDSGLDLDLALLALRWLGEAVSPRPGSPAPLGATGG